jgi:cation diffusion facilitator family transporter
VRDTAQSLAAAVSRSATVRRVTWIGLVVNVLLAGVKFAAGLLANSQAVVADAVHSLSDATTDVAILVGVRYWSAPADETHPHGHQRIETAVTLLIAVLLAGVAVALGYRAIATIHEMHRGGPGPAALFAAAASVVCKEILYRWSAAAGRRVRSPALVANAWHHRSDALSSLPAVLAVAGSMVNPSWAFLDHVGAVVVSVIIMQAVFRIGWPALAELMDAGAGEEARRRIEAVALGTAGVERVHAIRTRRVGSAIAVDLHVLVDGGISVREGHAIADAVIDRLLANGPNLADIVVHLEPAD